MKVLYLTPDERHKIDPTDAVRRGLARFRRDVREQLPKHLVSIKDPTAHIVKYMELCIARTPGHRPYHEIQLDSISKVGRQGGTFPLHQLKQLVKPYYDNVPLTVPDDEFLLAAVDYLVRLIKCRLETNGIHCWDFSPSRRHTAAGLPLGGHRGNFDTETVGFTRWRHPYPAVVGERFMRGKPRSIFILANPDYRYLEREFTVIRRWLVKNVPEFFMSWKNPYLQLYPTIRDVIRRPFLSVEEDYIEMDKNFSRALVQKYLYPIYETLLQDRFLKWAAYVEESFEAPIYWGSELWTGLHNLFSGILYTNDFETLYSVILMIAACLKVLGDPSRAVLLALGDDLTLLGHFSRKEALAMHMYMLETSAKLGLRMHDDEKARISSKDVRFLRQVFYPSWKPLSPAGAYPSVLTLNNIEQPENLQLRANVAIGADLQRLDGLQGSPDWELACLYYSRRLTLESIETLQAVDSLESPVDWWSRLYDVQWNARSSPSYWKVLSCIQRVRQQ